MVLHTIELQYRVDRASLSDLVFGPATASMLWPQAVKECAARGMLPASAGQIWGFRLESDGADHANQYFATSTAAIYFVADGAYRVAFYDTQRAIVTDNPLLTRGQEGCDAHRATNRWPVSMRDKTLTAMINDAEKRDRIITPGTRELALDGTYANDHSTTAILGEKSLAQDVQTWLKKKGYATAHNRLLNEQEIDMSGVNKHQAELRRVGVGGDYYVNFDYLDAYGQCDNYGRARGVARKTLIGNRGSA